MAARQALPAGHAGTARRRGRLVTTLCALALASSGLAGITSPASAVTTWTVSPSPTPLGPDAALDDVACVTTTNCFAVGRGTQGRSLVERWNGAAWSIVASPSPSLAKTELFDVSCASATDCFAVGSSDPNGSAPAGVLIEHWDGSTWSIAPTPTVAGALNGVSCVSASECFAVGNNGNRALVAHWNGTAWAVDLSGPSGTDFNELHSVSCVSATACVAVGRLSWSWWFGYETLIERWDGTAWSIDVSNGPGALNGVSCVSTTDCLAVGDSGSAASLHWNGTAWSPVTTPRPVGANGIVLADVSCSSTTACFAVGKFTKTSWWWWVTFVLRWDGSAWSIVASPNPVGARSELGGVACTSTTHCAAAGSSISSAGSKTLTERWNGAAWSVVPSPNPTGILPSRLEGVSCPATTLCFAVGRSFTPIGSKTLVEQWNGTAWSIVSSPNPVGAAHSTLSSVSCASTTRCFAVGSASSPTGSKTLTEQWNGTAWSIVSSPNPVGAGDGTLSSVSCVSTTRCFAVGSAGSPTGDRALIELWNGTAWSIALHANPVGATDSHLRDVSCVSTTRCFAVGSSYSPYRTTTLIERWDGLAWSAVTSPNPVTSTTSYLSAVSCAAATQCFAFGQWYAPSLTTLIERWNGTAWSIVPSPPNPTGAPRYLSDVSCATTAQCVAVGSSNRTAPTSKLLIEEWAGTAWSVTANANPAGSTSSELNGVACPTATQCFAVGASSSATAGPRTLIERSA